MAFPIVLALIAISSPPSPTVADARVALAAGVASQASDERGFWPWGRAGTDLDLGPPPDPGSEPRLAADPSGVAAGCDEIGKSFSKHGERILRVVVSQNRQYGVVWRADLATQGRNEPDGRLLCWREGRGPDGFHIGSWPLQMFNPRQTIAPLQPSSPAPAAPSR
jgi:hypothetical protein